MKSSNEYEYLPTIEGNRVLTNTPSDGNTKNIDQRKKLSMISATRSLEMEHENIKNDDKLYTNEDTNLDTDEYLDYTVKLVQIKKDDSSNSLNTGRVISKSQVIHSQSRRMLEGLKKYFVILMQSEYIYHDPSTYFQMNHSKEASPDLEESPRGQISSMKGRKYCNRTVILSKKPLSPYTTSLSNVYL